MEQYYHFNSFAAAKELKQQLCAATCGAMCGVLCVSNKIEKIKKQSK